MKRFMFSLLLVAAAAHATVDCTTGPKWGDANGNVSAVYSTASEVCAAVATQNGVPGVIIGSNMCNLTFGSFEWGALVYDLCVGSVGAGSGGPGTGDVASAAALGITSQQMVYMFSGGSAAVLAFYLSGWVIGLGLGLVRKI